MDRIIASINNECLLYNTIVLLYIDQRNENPGALRVNDSSTFNWMFKDHTKYIFKMWVVNKKIKCQVKMMFPDL